MRLEDFDGRGAVLERLEGVIVRSGSDPQPCRQRLRHRDVQLPTGDPSGAALYDLAAAGLGKRNAGDVGTPSTMGRLGSYTSISPAKQLAA